VIATAALALAAACGPVPASPQPQSLTPQPDASSSSLAGSTQVPEPDHGDLTWTRTDLSDLHGEGFGWPRDLVAGSDGFMLLAEQIGAVELQKVIRSPDGLRWSTDEPAPFDGRVTTIASNGDQALLFAQMPRLSLFSWKAGWVDRGPVGGTVTLPEGSLWNLGGTPFGWIASAYGGGQAAHWPVVSADGLTWSDLPMRDLGSMVEVAVQGDLVALCFRDAKSVVITRDGVSFTTTALAQGDAAVEDLAAGPRGLVAVGASGGASRVWFSSDGLEWRVARIDRADVSIIQVTAFRGVFVGLGLSPVADGTVTEALWVSADGERWSLMREIPDAREVGYFELAASPDALVVMGQRSPPDGADAVVLWTLT
jgi:hypothetical protein